MIFYNVGTQFRYNIFFIHILYFGKVTNKQEFYYPLSTNLHCMQGLIIIYNQMYKETVIHYIFFTTSNDISNFNL